MQQQKTTQRHTLTHLHTYRRYKQSLFLAAKKRQGARTRQLQRISQRKAEVAAELASCRDSRSRAEDVLLSLQQKKDELSEHLHELTRACEPQLHMVRQARAGQHKLLWLRSHFPLETEMAERTIDDAAAHEAYDAERQRLVRRAQQLAEMKDAAAAAGGGGGGGGGVGSFEDDAAADALRLEAAELRCRRAAQVAWRKVLSGCRGGVLTAAEAQQMCGRMRRRQPAAQGAAATTADEDIQREIEAIGSAEVVETWLDEAGCHAEDDVLDSLGCFMEAFADETEEIAAQLEEKKRHADRQMECGGMPRL